MYSAGFLASGADKVLDILIALSMIGAPAQDAAAQDRITVTAEKKKADRRVCKRTVTTGSVMPKVTCRTAAEWEAEREKSLASMELRRADERWRQGASLEKGLLPREDTRPR